MTKNEVSRIDILEGILLKLHHGAEPESVQEEFNEHFTGVSAIEISMMEHQLIYGDGPITFRDVLKLCNVHANLFKGTIADGELHDSDKPGHPVRIFKEENMALRSALLRVNNILSSFKDMDPAELHSGMLQGLKRQFDVLGQFDNHYKRKEHLFFPMMEKYGHDAPPKVMWAKDDEIRDLFKRAYKQMEKFPDGGIDKLIQRFEDFQFEFNEMIFKEEAILINILLEVLTTEDWYEIAKQSPYYGYSIIRPTEEWMPDDLHNGGDSEAIHKGVKEESEEKTLDQEVAQPIIKKSQHSAAKDTIQSIQIETKKVKVPGGYLTVSFEEDSYVSPKDNYTLNPAIPFVVGDGFLSVEQIKLIFDYIPARVSFFDKDDQLQYFNHKNSASYSQRKLDDIGKQANECYSSKVWERLEAVITDFKDQRRTDESFWFPYQDHFIHLDYKALIDTEGNYQGFVEIEQNIQPILDITTEKWRNLLPLSKVDTSLKSPADLTAIQKKSIDVFNLLDFNHGQLNFTWSMKQGIQTDDLDLFGRDTVMNIGVGFLSINQVQLIFNQLPFEITFVDEEHTFKYFNNTGPYDQMLFQRSPIEIGRHLEYCHPARSWPKVQRLSEDLKHQRRFVEPMWFSPMGKLIYILYMGTQDHADNYRGIVETVQDASIYIDKVNNGPKEFID